MTTVYVALINDRHADLEAYVFTTPTAAIEYARTCAYTYAQNADDVQEQEIADWLYYAQFSPESDYVRVVQCELRGE